MTATAEPSGMPSYETLRPRAVRPNVIGAMVVGLGCLALGTLGCVSPSAEEHAPPREPSPDAVAAAAERAVLAAECWAVFDELQSRHSEPVEAYIFPEATEVRSCGLSPRVGDTETSRPAIDELVLERLEATRTTIRFDETRLENAATFLGRISGMDIVVLPHVHEGRDQDELAISLTLVSPESVDRILDLITVLLGLEWRVAGGKVEIDLPVSPAGDHVIRLYDVRDIHVLIENFPGYDCHFHSGE